MKSEASQNNFRDSIELDFNNSVNSIDYFMKKKGINQKIIFPKSKTKNNRIFSSIKINR